MTFDALMNATMHQISQALQTPTVVCLILLVLVMVFCLGWLLVEIFTERRYFKVNHRKVVVDMRNADYSEVGAVIQNAALLKEQREKLLFLASNMGLPDEELASCAQIELDKSSAVYQRRVHITDTIAKIAPMFGMMGTLIPLGPGIVAMGQGDVAALSQSLLIAFDTTVLGLIVAVVAVVVSRIRKTWYGRYHTVMQALMNCILEEAEQAREEGVQLPYGNNLELRPPKRQASAPQTIPAAAGSADMLAPSSTPAVDDSSNIDAPSQQTPVSVAGER